MNTRTTKPSIARRLGRLKTKGIGVGVLAATALAVVPSGASAANQYRVELTNPRSGLKADVMWASQAANTGVFLWENNTSLSQEFDLLDGGNGYFRIRARHSNQCLMLDYRAAYSNGNKIIQYPYCSVNYAPGEWRRAYVAGAAYPVLVNRQTGKCLDVDNSGGGTPVPTAVLQQWDCITSGYQWNAVNQQWRIAAA